MTAPEILREIHGSFRVLFNALDERPPDQQRLRAMEALANHALARLAASGVFPAWTLEASQCVATVDPNGCVAVALPPELMQLLARL